MSEPRVCTICGGAMLSVVYYDSDDEPIGGHYVCTNCGPRSAVDVTPKSTDLRRKLLERKAS